MIILFQAYFLRAPADALPSQDLFLLFVLAPIAGVIAIVSLSIFQKKLSASASEARLLEIHRRGIQESNWSNVYFQETTTIRIICLALNEAILLFGLISALLLSNHKLILPFFFVSFTLNLFMFPRLAIDARKIQQKI
jgi:hypothetical protein